MYNAGDFDGTETVMIPLNTFSSDDPSASVTVTNLANTDVYIYKDASLTERASSAGVAVDIDIETGTGCHWITIDLSDNDDAGFYASGSQFLVRVEGITVDGATLNVIIGGFTIGKMQAAMTAALVAHNLDHLCLTATGGTDMTTEVADNTILSRILSNGDTSVFVPSTDGLQPIKDHIGDGTNLTEAGGDGDHLTEAGGDGDHLNEAGGDGDHLSAIPWNAAWDAEVESEVDDALGGGTGTALTAIPWNAAWDAEVESEVDDALGGGTGTALTAIPWNAAWDAEVQSEAADALTAFDPPTKTEMDTAHALLSTSVEIGNLNDITVANIIAGVADGSYDLQEMMRVIFAACAGKSDGGGGSPIHFRDSGDGKNRITATVDANGNRTAMTLDAS